MFISAGKAGNETRKIHGTFVSVQEKQVKKSGKFMEYCMFISARKAGKEITKNHGIFLSVQESRQRNKDNSLFIFISARKADKETRRMNVGKTNIFAVSRRTDVLLLNL